MDHDPALIAVRRASPIDLTRITEVCLQGLPDDPTFDYLWRYRLQYPDDNRFFWQQRLKTSLFDAKKVMLVAVLKESVNVAPSRDSEEKKLPLGSHQDGAAAAPETKETIVAFAVWERNVKGGLTSWQRGWLDILHGSWLSNLSFEDVTSSMTLAFSSARFNAHAFLVSFSMALFQFDPLRIALTHVV